MIKGRQLFSNQGIGRYFTNTIWLLAEKGLRIIDAFFIGIWLARYLGPDDFGILSYAESFVYLFAAFAALGLDQIVVRELVKDESRRDELLGTTFVLRLLGFVVMFLGIFFVTRILDNTAIKNTMVMVIGITIFFQSIRSVDFYFQSKVLSKYTAISNLIAVGILSIIKVILILSEAPLIYFAYALVLEWILIAIGYSISYIHHKLSFLTWRFKWSVAKSLLKKSWFLIIGSVAAALYMKIDQIMIDEILDERSVGLYSVAVKMTSIWIFVTVAITQSVFPSLVSMRKKDKALFLKRLQQLYDVLIKIAVMVSILYTIFASYFVPFLFGSEYTESSHILVLYIWSIVFVFLSNGSWGYYLNENLERFSSIRLVIGAVINITLNLFFIEWYGLVGAAYATLISYAISGYFVNALFTKTRTNFYLQTKAFLNIFKINTWIHPL
ncbi:O-unit flippase [Dokdonia pacifica]|uniref:Membrane protein involved in the export of O-antigen and teichoic acid n=1 Tax=Dokdonia pacifica TaxID=1627892 RepID=A0A238WGZ2_9FLAO|nr:flippase [Dokdonia pacifica]GGG20934.1 O-unit flippase [Dokdonia pacifica]SNR45494.1 Membrane protein involved in the export of O-antigen and teichoic acid [Dokdonia pacifica]